VSNGRRKERWLVLVSVFLQDCNFCFVPVRSKTASRWRAWTFLYLSDFSCRQSICSLISRARSFRPSKSASFVKLRSRYSSNARFVQSQIHKRWSTRAFSLSPYHQDSFRRCQPRLARLPGRTQTILCEKRLPRFSLPPSTHNRDSSTARQQ